MAQTLVSLAILGTGWFVLARVQVGGLPFVIAIALAAQLVYATTVEARKQGLSGRR